MLTYQLQTRVFKLEKGSQFTFPNRAELEFKLGPATAFGTDSSPSRTVLKAHKATLHINANTGRWLAKSDPPLDPLHVVVETPDSTVSLVGDILKYSFQCNDITQLEGTISAFRWLFPALLNLVFSEPPIVLLSRGRVGDTLFRWEHRPDEWQIQMRTVTTEHLEQHFIDSYNHLALFSDLMNRRLAAAMNYFYIAVRLNVCGDSPWEFMAETILNYCKCLDILFAKTESTYDDARKELGALGYSAEEIEGDFIPLLILRSWVDVAHPKVALFKVEDLRILYKYLSQSEESIRQLLNRIVARIENGSYSIRQESDLSLGNDERKEMDRLVGSMKSRLGKASGGG